MVSTQLGRTPPVTETPGSFSLRATMLAASWAETVASFCARRLSVHICDGSATVSGVWDRARSRIFRSFAFIQTEVWDWGWNEHGDLGVGTTENVSIPVKIWPREAREATSGRVGI
ncbi:hypothetical protein DFH08DRAFT_360705 [Mycena albidolilacea]|uniref:Uncharacterized protein n=1 Tax=Mycena albidolilacea TaxID=1033008 RepID=A0AAD7AJK6_9AGAR|nr:hypothetical protein DFH08DRAFT_360705 [Mycena albidolilacea]